MQPDIDRGLPAPQHATADTPCGESPAIRPGARSLLRERLRALGRLLGDSSPRVREALRTEFAAAGPAGLATLRRASDADDARAYVRSIAASKPDIVKIWVDDRVVGGFC